MSASPSSEPLVEDNVVLRCKADRLIYGNLAWFRVTNISESEQVASVQPCRSLTLQRRHLSQGVLSSLQGTNVTLELPLPNVSHQDEGLYACQVENIKTQERTCLLRRLSLKSEKNLQILLLYSLFSEPYFSVLFECKRITFTKEKKQTYLIIMSEYLVIMRKDLVIRTIAWSYKGASIISLLSLNL